MNEQEFQELLRSRAQELISEGRSTEEIQQWVDTQKSNYATQNEREEELPDTEVDTTSDTEVQVDQVEQPADDGEAPIVEGQPTDEIETDGGEPYVPTTEVEAKTARDWTKGKFKGEDKAAFDNFKETGKFDPTLLGGETQLRIQDEQSEKMEKSILRKESASEEEYLEKLGQRELDNDDRGDLWDGTWLSRSFEKAFTSGQLGGIAAGTSDLATKANDRLSELEETRDSMDPEDYEREVQKALTIKNASEYTAWEKWEEGEEYNQVQAAADNIESEGAGPLNLVDEDGNLDWKAIGKGIGDWSILKEVVNQLPNTVIAGASFGSGIAGIATAIPSALWFGATMANEYRTKLINKVLDDKYGAGKWGKDEYFAYTQSDKGKDELLEAKITGVAAGQVDRIVDRITTKGVKAIPGLGLALKGTKGALTKIATNAIGAKGSKILGLGIGFAGETALEMETEHLQEELGTAVADRAVGDVTESVPVRALKRLWNYKRVFGDNSLYSPEELQEIGNLRTITAITAGVLSGGGKGARAGYDRIVNGKRKSPADIANSKPTEAKEENKKDLENAGKLAKEIKNTKDPEVKETLKEGIQDAVDRVGRRNVNHNIIMNEMSGEAIGELTDLSNAEQRYTKAANQEGVSPETKAIFEKKAANAKQQFEDKYYAPLKRAKAKQDVQDDVNKIDSELEQVRIKINGLKKDDSNYGQKKKELLAKEKGLIDQIGDQEFEYQELSPNDPQTKLEAIKKRRSGRHTKRDDNTEVRKKASVIREQNNQELAQMYNDPGLSNVVKERVVSEFLENNGGIVKNLQKKYGKHAKEGTNFGGAITKDDIKAIVQDQMMRKLESFDPDSKNQFGTHLLSNLDKKVGNIVVKGDTQVTFKRKDYEGIQEYTPVIGKFETNDDTSFEGTLADLEAEDEVTTGTGAEFDSDPSYETQDPTNSTTKILVDKVYDIPAQMQEDLEDKIADIVETKTLPDIREGDRKVSAALGKEVQDDIISHLDKSWGTKPEEVLDYLSNNTTEVYTLLPAWAKGGKKFQGFFQDGNPSVEEWVEFFGAEGKNGRRRRLGLKRAAAERISDAYLDSALTKYSDLSLIRPDYNGMDFQVEPEVKQKAVEEYEAANPVDALVSKLKAVWGNVVKIHDDQASWDTMIAKIKKTRENKGIDVSNFTGDTIQGAFVTENGEIFLNPKRTRKDTALHEFGHLWSKMTKTNNPELYARGVELLKDSPYWELVKNNPAYSEYNEDRFAEEVMATAIGHSGTKGFESLHKSGKWDTFVKKMSTWVKDMFGIKTDQDLLDMTMGDFIKNASIDIIEGRFIEDVIHAKQGKGIEMQYLAGPELKFRQQAANNLLYAFKEQLSTDPGRYDQERAAIKLNKRMNGLISKLGLDGKLSTSQTLEVLQKTEDAAQLIIAKHNDLDGNWGLHDSAVWKEYVKGAQPYIDALLESRIVPDSKVFNTEDTQNLDPAVKTAKLEAQMKAIDQSNVQNIPDDHRVSDLGKESIRLSKVAAELGIPLAGLPGEGRESVAYKKQTQKQTFTDFMKFLAAGDPLTRELFFDDLNRNVITWGRTGPALVGGESAQLTTAPWKALGFTDLDTFNELIAEIGEDNIPPDALAAVRNINKIQLLRGIDNKIKAAVIKKHGENYTIEQFREFTEGEGKNIGFDRTNSGGTNLVKRPTLKALSKFVADTSGQLNTLFGMKQESNMRNNGFLEGLELTEQEKKHAFGLLEWKSQMRRLPINGKGKFKTQEDMIQASFAKRKVAKHLIKSMGYMVKNGHMTKATAEMIMVMQGWSQTGFFRSSAPIIGRSTNLDPTFTDEHIFPASKVSEELLNAAVNEDASNVDAAMDSIMEDFVQIQLNKGTDKLVEKAGLASSMPDNWREIGKMFSDKGLPKALARYFNSQIFIDPHSVTITHNYKTGKKLDKPTTVAEIMGWDASSGFDTSSDIEFSIDNSPLLNAAALNENEINNPRNKEIRSRLEQKREVLEHQIEISEERGDENRKAKAKELVNAINDSYLYKGSGKLKKSKIDQNARQRLDDLKFLVAEASDLSSAQLTKLLAEAQTIIADGKARQRAKVESNKEIKKKVGEEVSSRIDTSHRANAGFRISSIFSPDSNNDFFGLISQMYSGDKKQRDSDKEFFKDNVFDELADANFEYDEMKRGMKDSFQGSLETLLGAKGGFKFRKAKKAFESNPNTAGIELDGEVLTEPQLIKIFNTLKDPSKHASMFEAGIDEAMVDAVIDYIHGKPELAQFATDLVNIYEGPRASLDAKLDAHGYKNDGQHKMDLDNHPKDTQRVLERIFGKGNVPDIIPSTPFSTQADQGLDLEAVLEGNGDPATLLSNKLIQKSSGKKFDISGKDVFSDFANFTGPGGPLRSASFLSFARNMSGMFNSENLKKLNKQFGDGYTDSLKGSLKRIVSGRTQPNNLTKVEKRAYKFINGSIANVMFLNTRSGILQLISFANYAGDNPGGWMKAIGKKGTKEWKDAVQLINDSAWFQARGKGATELSLDEIFQQAGKPSLISKIHQFGYSLTKMGDKFAISTGGVPFVVDRISTLRKQGLSKEEAHTQALKDFIAKADESQQSSRPERLGGEQTGMLGRMVLAFANTPQQYNRIIQRNMADFGAAARAGDGAGMIAAGKKIAYYGVVQNLIFGALQSALWTIWDDDDDEEKDHNKKVDLVNSMMSTIMRGAGIYGALASVAKDISLLMYRQHKKDGQVLAGLDDKILKAVSNMSPAIASKNAQIKKVYATTIYPQSQIASEHQKLNENLTRGASAVNAVFNIPLDRVLKLTNDVGDLFADDLDAFQKVLRVGGWSRYGLGVNAAYDERAADKKDRKRRRDYDRKDLLRDKAIRKRERKESRQN